MIGSDYLQICLQFGRLLLLQILLSCQDVWVSFCGIFGF